MSDTPFSLQQIRLESYSGNRPLDTREVASVSSNFQRQLKAASYVPINRWTPLNERGVTSIRQLLKDVYERQPRMYRDDTTQTILSNERFRFDFQGRTTSIGHNRSPSHVILAIQTNTHGKKSDTVMTLIVPKWLFDKDNNIEISAK